MLILLLILNLILSFFLVIYIFKVNKKMGYYLGDQLGEVNLKSYHRRSDQFKKEGNDLLARMVLKNAFIHQPANRSVFTEYIDYVLEKIDSSSEQEQQRSYLAEAFEALFTFSEYAELNDFNLIEDYQEKLEGIREELGREGQEEIRARNQKLLKQLQELVEKLEEVDGESEIREILEEATRIEERLEFEFFTADDNKCYKDLQKSFERLAVSKGENLNQNNYQQYNQEVVTRINNIFTEVSNHEKDYKKGKKDIIELVKDDLATVNTEYLTSEALTYFNHVYNYIFTLISDEKKFELTKVMTTTRKDLVG
ncbi:hypothetical protein MWH25_04745 [Natroniella acetigena]|uniref:hypothetical protein n=1 Tax=Natroniella acetigena TaxID=52004 RepID=UPI00200B2D39|nr:hypothetical protein [Natroniella acetigena]MCK8827054.1 hypothetical protein [Natroniella acetigena]